MQERRSYQTLEFWLTIAALLLSVALVVAGGFVDNPETSKLMIVLGTIAGVFEGLGYKVIRTSQKNGAAKAAAIVGAATAALGAPEKPANP